MRKKIALFLIAAAAMISCSSCYATFRAHGHYRDRDRVYIEPVNTGLQAVSGISSSLQLPSSDLTSCWITFIN